MAQRNAVSHSWGNVRHHVIALCSQKHAKTVETVQNVKRKGRTHGKNRKDHVPLGKSEKGENGKMGNGGLKTRGNGGISPHRPKNKN